MGNQALAQILCKKNHPYAFQVFGDLVTTKAVKKASSKKMFKLKIDANSQVERDEWIHTINSSFEKKKSKKQFQTLLNILQEKLQQFSTEISETLQLRLSIQLDRSVIQCEQQHLLDVLLDGKFFSQLAQMLKQIYDSSPTSIKIDHILIKCDEEEKSTIDENAILSLVLHPKQDVFEAISQHSLKQLLEQEKFLMIQNIIKDWKEYQEILKRMKNLFNNEYFALLLESDDSIDLKEEKSTVSLLQQRILESLHALEEFFIKTFENVPFKEVFCSVLVSVSLAISFSEELQIRINTNCEDMPCSFIGKVSALTGEFLYANTYICYFSKLKQELAAKLSNCEMEWEKSFGKRINISVLLGRMIQNFIDKSLLFTVLQYIKQQIFHQIATLIGIFKDFEYDLAHYFNSIVIVAENTATVASLPSFLSRKVVLIRLLVTNEKEMRFEDVDYKTQIVNHISKSSPNSLTLNFLEIEEDMLESVDTKLLGKKKQQDVINDDTSVGVPELISNEAKYSLVSSLVSVISNSCDEDVLDAIQREIQSIQSLMTHKQQNQSYSDLLRFVEEYVALVVEDSSEVLRIMKELRSKYDLKTQEPSVEEIFVVVLRYILPKRIQENRKNRRNVVLLGEEKVGKTSLLCRLKNSEIRINPSIGFASEVIEHKSLHYVFHDMGGNVTQLSNWKFYLTKCKRVDRVDAIIYVLDLSVREEKQIEEIRASLKKSLKFFCKLNESLFDSSDKEESNSAPTTPSNGLLSPTQHNTRRNSLRSPIIRKKRFTSFDFVDYRLPNLIVVGTKEDLPEALTIQQIQTVYLDWIHVHIVAKQKYCRGFYFQKVNLVGSDNKFVNEILQFMN